VQFGPTKNCQLKEINNETRPIIALLGYIAWPCYCWWVWAIYRTGLSDEAIKGGKWIFKRMAPIQTTLGVTYNPSTGQLCGKFLPSLGLLLLALSKRFCRHHHGLAYSLLIGARWSINQSI